MKPHSHYCQDPNCPSPWDEEGCTNVPREERRPKVGDRVRNLLESGRGQYSVFWVGIGQFKARNEHGVEMLSRQFAEHGATWDFADSAVA